MNRNPLYLIYEGRFLNAFKKYWRADKGFAKQRYFGGFGRKLSEPYIKTGANNVGVLNDLIIKLEIDRRAGKITQEVMDKYIEDARNYLAKRDAWKSARSELWDETKNLFKSKPISLDTSNQGKLLPVAAAGLGTLGFTTLANDPTVKIGYSNDKKRINPKAQRYPR